VKTDKFNINLVVPKRLLLKKDKIDKRDFKVGSLFKTGVPVFKIDLRYYCNPVKNQGSLQSCSAFAFGAAFEIMKNIENDRAGNSVEDMDTSERFIYYNTRVLENTTGINAGVYLRDACKALVSNGAGIEYFCPYITSQFSVKPSFLSYISGRFMKVDSYYRCNTLNDVKTALSNRIPVVFGMLLNENYINCDGFYNKTGGKMIGGHAQVVVGFDDEKKSVLVRNSWGVLWGDAGYAWVNYDVFEGNSYDYWVIIPHGCNYMEVSK